MIFDDGTDTGKVFIVGFPNLSSIHQMMIGHMVYDYFEQIGWVSVK